MESTAKYIVPVVGGPMDGAVLYLTVPPHPVLLVPARIIAPPLKDASEAAVPCWPHRHKYLLQPSPARYIYEHLACS